VASSWAHHRHPGTGGDQLALELGRWRLRVEWHGDAAHPERRQIRHDEEPRVGGDDRQPVSGLEAGPHETAAQLLDLTLELSVGRDAPLAYQGGRALRMPVDDVAEIHPTNTPCSLSDRCRS